MGAVEGMAVTGVDNTNGAWEYSLDGGTTWLTFGGGLSDSSATLLLPTDLVRFVPDPVGPSRTADAVTTCEVGEAPASADSRGPISARLVRSSIHLRRRAPDNLGRMKPHAPAELAGAVAHELAHALGFAGHERGRWGVLSREVESTRHLGERLLAGGALRAESLQALYRVPSGAVVGRHPLTGASVERWRRLAALAAAEDWPRRFAQVGDARARFGWRSSRGRDYVLWLDAPARQMRSREAWHLEAGRLAAAVLDDG